MKKIIVIALTVCSVATYAQENRKADRKSDNREVNKQERGKRENRMLEDFKELNLSEAQQNKLKTIFEAEKRNAPANRERFSEDEMPSQSEMREMREKMKERMGVLDAKIKNVLTDEQYAAWKEKQQQRMKEFINR